MFRQLMRFGLVSSSLVMFSACNPSETDTATDSQSNTETVASASASVAQGLSLASTAFKENEPIPIQHSCEGKDISPALAWIDLPKGTRSLTLIVDDLDSPQGNFTHWLIYNVPPEISILPEDLPRQEALSLGALQGRNSFGQIGWGGPCPPSKAPHRYIFRLYALDTMLTLEPGATRQQLDAAINGHLLGQTRLTGIYIRNKIPQ